MGFHGDYDAALEGSCLCSSSLGFGNWVASQCHPDSLSSNIWFGQMLRHLEWDCKAKESATPFFCCDSMGFTTVSTEPMAANSHNCGQSRGVKEQSKEHKIFCPCVERWKTRRTKGKDSTKSKKGNRMEEIIHFPSRSRAIPFTLRISLRRRGLLSGWALLIGAFQ